MKKIFTFLAGILISIGMQAVDQITMGQFGAWDSEKMQVAEGNVITYDEGSSWVGGDVWLGKDLSAYEYVCIVLEDCHEWGYAYWMQIDKSIFFLKIMLAFLQMCIFCSTFAADLP